jgi:AAA ATPase-like protein
LFVGREAELVTFREWLHFDAEIPEILNLSGPSGVGKSSLLREFERVAAERDRAVVLVDGGSIPATSRGLLRALSEPASDDLDEVVGRLNAARSVILLDTFDQLGELTDYLQTELLPRLATSVRVVIASRFPLGLAWNRNELWNKVIRPLRLEGFSTAESRDYLGRRGLAEPSLIDRVMKAAGCNPLALSLAADLALRFGVRDFPSAPEWRLAVRTLVDRMLVEVREPQLRDLLDASLAVRQFDEATLSAISGRDDIGAAFAQLCRLSMMCPAEHGLMLHEDVRRRLTEDLAWRHPDRYAALRARALAYYRERVRSAPPDEREWLVADRFYLWGNALIQELFFSSDEPGQVWVDVYRPGDHAGIQRLFTERLAYLLPPDSVLGDLAPPDEDGDFLEAILRYPGARIRVGRDRDGRALGFTTVLPVCQETIPLLDGHPALAPLIHAYWDQAALEALPASPDRSNIFYLLHLVQGGTIPGAVRGSLLRDLSGVFASSGIYLSSTYIPAHKRMLDVCGFQLMPAARNGAWGTDYPVDGYVLDLSQIGFEPWIEAVMSGRRLPRSLNPAELETELQTALRHWTDDGWLSRSSLMDLPAVTPVDGQTPRSAALRQAILQALTAARAASEGNDSPYRAVELVYLSRRPCAKQGARDLAVSRATLYRLVKQGIHGLAEALTTQA